MRKSVGDYSGTPYVTTLLNCLLWVFYGSSAVTNTTLIISINGAGLVLEAIYISIHLFYGTEDSRVKLDFFTICPTKKIKILFPQTNSSDPSSLTFLIFLEQLGRPKLITMEFCVLEFFLHTGVLQLPVVLLCFLSLQKKVGGATFMVVVTYVIMAICVMWKVALENRELVVGSICVVVNILMYAAPLTIMVSYKFCSKPQNDEALRCRVVSYKQIPTVHTSRC
jgi:hypothetical protein